MPLDPRIILGAAPAPGSVAPFDPLQAMGRIAQVQGLQQQAQVGQMQLADAQRAEQERKDLGAIYRRHVVTDPTTGESTINLPGAMTEAYRVNPATAFKMQQEYARTQAESAKTALEARKLQLERAQEGFKVGGQVAQGIEARIAAGQDPQQAWQWGLETMQRAGLPTQGITPTYDANALAGWRATATTVKEKLDAEQAAVNAEIRKQELAETQQRTQIEREGLGIRREDVAARREDIAERRREREQTRETQAGARTFEQEDKLRNDYIAQTKPYQTQSDFYGRIETAAKDPSAAGDLALIYSFMKLLDPGSTVLSGEYATAANAGSVPERIYSQYNRLVSGELLGEAEKGTIRKDYVDRARRLYDQATKDYQRTKAVFEDRARRYNLNPANVTQDLGTTAPREAPGAGGAPAAPAAPKVLREEDIARTIEDSKAAGRPVTREQVIEEGRKRGFQVP